MGPAMHLRRCSGDRGQLRMRTGKGEQWGDDGEAKGQRYGSCGQEIRCIQEGWRERVTVLRITGASSNSAGEVNYKYEKKEG